MSKKRPREADRPNDKPGTLSSPLMRNHHGYLVPETCDHETLFLAQRNGHPRDTAIAFDDKPHLYYVKGEGGYTSVTTVLHELFAEFDGENIARKMIIKRNFPHAEKYAKYRSMVEETRGDPNELIRRILASWENNRNEKAQLGTEMHREIELFYNNLAEREAIIRETPLRQHLREEGLVELIVHGFLARPALPTREMAFFYQYDQEQIQTKNWKAFRSEWMLWDEDLRVSGSIDMIYYDPKTQTYHMRDWKRSGGIQFHGFGKYGLGPCQHLADCNFSKYSLQLNMYRFLLEKNYGIKISSMALVVFHPDNEAYEEFLVQDMQSTIASIFQARQTKIKK